MKRKTTCILACVLIIATIIPSIALAASNAAILDKLKLSDVKKYDVALPTKGTKKTEKQINDLLKKIPYKPSGKGNTDYKYNLSFSRQVSKKPGNYTWVGVSKQWYKYIDKTKKSFFYYEGRDLTDMKTGISCYIEKSDTKNGNSYSWVKGKKTGEHNTWKIETNNNNTLKPLNFKLYPDTTVLDEKCMVYSNEYRESYGTTTIYYFISRKTGQCIKNIYVDEYGIYNSIDFEKKLVDKADSFFDPPKDIKFSTNTD